MTDNTDNSDGDIQEAEAVEQSVEATGAVSTAENVERVDVVDNKPLPSTSKESPPANPSVCDIFYPRNIDLRQDAIYLASFPQIVLFWPTVLACFLCAIAQHFGASSIVVGWCFSCVVFFNFLPLIQDFDQKKFLRLV